MSASTQAEVFQRQKPLNTGLGATTTAEEVMQGISLAGKTVIITGGYSGLGKENARVFVNAGAHVIVPTRDLQRAQEAMEGIEVQFESMDLLDPESIDAFARKFLETGKPLDILINSAGIMACPLTRDSRGYELQFATNHLGHFQLTTKLLPALRKAQGARIVSVSSWGHHFSNVNFEDPNFLDRTYDPWVAYGQSKTANILFALALDERLKDDGIRAIAIHPGGILDTNLAKHLPKEAFMSMNVVDENGKPIHDPSRNLKNVQEGAATQVWAATNPTLEGIGGVYCENCDLAELEEEDKSAVRDFGPLTRHDKVLPYALNLHDADRLWALSEAMLHVGE